MKKNLLITALFAITSMTLNLSANDKFETIYVKNQDLTQYLYEINKGGSIKHYLLSKQEFEKLNDLKNSTYSERELERKRAIDSNLERKIKVLYDIKNAFLGDVKETNKLLEIIKILKIKQKQNRNDMTMIYNKIPNNLTSKIGVGQIIRENHERN